MENLSSLPTYIPSSDFFFMKFFHVEKRKNWSQIPCSLVGKKYAPFRISLILNIAKFG
jgi:hypothetical protein